MEPWRHREIVRGRGVALRCAFLALAAALVVRPALGQEEGAPAPSADAPVSEEDSAAPTWSPGEQAELQRFCGSYRNVLDDAGARILEDAMNPVIEALRPSIRGMGRRRLFAANRPIPRITIRPRDGAVRVDLSNDRIFDSPMGEWRSMRAPEGTRLRVTHRLQNGKLVETMYSRLGGARHTFTLSEGGRRLRFHGRVWGGMLPADIVYDLDFIRTDG